MNLPPRWVEVLAQAGHDAVHWSAVGSPGASDHELMNWAAGEGRVVLTADLDFPAILASMSRRQPSVVLLRSDTPSPALLADVVLAALKNAEKELISGAVISIDAARARVRILPLEGR